MFKSKVRSMQRGSACHGPTGLHQPIAPIVPVLREQELMHFGIGDKGRAAFVAKLMPTIRSLARAGFRKPRDVSKLLNKAGEKTFAGQNWTPRLTFFLLSFAFGTSIQTSEKRGLAQIEGRAQKLDRKSTCR